MIMNGGSPEALIKRVEDKLGENVDLVIRNTLPDISDGLPEQISKSELSSALAMIDQWRDEKAAFTIVTAFLNGELKVEGATRIGDMFDGAAVGG